MSVCPLVTVSVTSTQPGHSPTLPSVHRAAAGTPSSAVRTSPGADLPHTLRFSLGGARKLWDVRVL